MRAPKIGESNYTLLREAGWGIYASTCGWECFIDIGPCERLAKRQ